MLGFQQQDQNLMRQASIKHVKTISLISISLLLQQFIMDQPQNYVFFFIQEQLILNDVSLILISILLLQMNKFQKFLVGTLFDEEEQDKKTNLSNMKAKDPFGNTRWKGAFTGGFEAGFKNTCGSKEGWTPSTFISSVYKKAETNQRTIFDYMDKEDLGRETISQNIVLNTQFQTVKNETLNITLQQSIGQKILHKLKKLQAHRSAPQNQQQLQQLFKIYAQEDKVKPTYQLKDLIQPLTVGAMTAQIIQDDFIEAYEDFYRKVIREHSREQSEDQIKKRRQENKIYFDFTRPLQDEPEYLRQIQEIQQSEKPRKRKKNLINQQSLRSIYSSAIPFKQFSKAQQPQKVPEDYDPYWKVRDMQVIGKPKEKQQHKGRPLGAEQRGQILGEVKLSSKFVTSQNSLANKFISKQKNVIEHFKYFEDEKKNKRFHQYMQEMEGKRISSQLEYQTYQQAEKERIEFETVYQSQKQHYKERKQKKKEVEPKIQEFHISRRVESWRPQKLLCKRFNVLTPYIVKKEPGTKQYFYS